MKNQWIVFLFFSALLPLLSFADSSDSEVHRLKAQKFVEAKDWSSAQKEAEAAVKSDPNNKEAWLMLGIVEQRLEHNPESAEAYRKYLSSNPPEDKAKAVRERLAEVEVRSDTQQKKETAEVVEKFGPRASGFFVAFSPVYKPTWVSDMNGTLSNSFEGGFKLGNMSLGFRYASGTMANFLAAPSGSLSAAAPVYSAQGAGTQRILEGYIQGDIAVSEPFKKTGPIGIYIPIYIGGVESTVTGNSRTFGNLAMDVASGVNVQWYTKSPFLVGLSAMYHLSLPLWGIREDANSVSIQNSTGAEVKGSVSGFELKLTATILF